MKGLSSELREYHNNYEVWLIVSGNWLGLDGIGWVDSSEFRHKNPDNVAEKDEITLLENDKTIHLYKHIKLITWHTCVPYQQFLLRGSLLPEVIGNEAEVD